MMRNYADGPQRNALGRRAIAKCAVWALVGCAAVGIPTTQLASKESPVDSSAPSMVFHVPGEKVDVVDGDTIWIGIHKVRLKGIEALESKQSCRDGTREVQCAEEGKRFLASLLQREDARCEVQFDNFGKPAMDRNRYLATCYAGDFDINRQLVELGWAVAAPRNAGPDLELAEASAREKRLGIHRYAFELPWDYRRARRGAKRTS